MAVSTGFNAVIKLLTGGTCTCTNDVIDVTGGTCTTVGYLDSYTLNDSLETIDVTSFGDKVRKSIPGFPAVSLDMSGSYNYADSSQAAIWSESMAASHATKIFNIYESGSKMTFKGYITSVSAGSSVGSKSTFSATATGTAIPSTCTVA